MGRGKHEHCWSHVTKVENGHSKWICKYCNEKFSGGASRIQAHLGLGGKGGGIRRCSNYPANQHNLASTSTNPPQPVINTIHVTHDQGVNGSGRNRSVCESEINQLILHLDFEKNDIEKQLQCLESHGKKRKSEVDVWLEELLELKESVRHMNNLDDTHDISELVQNMKRHKEEKPLTLSTEYVGWNLDENIRTVLELLDDDKVFVIGIYGMGGVGKTLLATLVENEIKRKTTFKDVFRITVSDNTNISKLQYDIAKRIGVKLDEDEEGIRANYLCSALEKKGKSIIILDDVWKYIDLQKVGIHPKVNGIKVILTTRLEHICHQMDCLPNHIIEMVPLNIGEDWHLFKVKLGHNGTPMTLSPEIEKIAKDIVSRCAGLPLGISVIARTMKGIHDIHQWKHALNKLKILAMGQEFEEEVLKVLKRSYDNLMDKDFQNCFLYCALLSANHDYFIHKDELIMKLVDNGQINGNMCLEEIFDEGNTLLNKLESHSLISSVGCWIFTHPLVRSMACYILKKSQRNVIVKFNERMTKKISLSHGWATDLELVHILDCGIDEISEGLSPNCPKLSTLILNKVSISHVPQSFFKYMNSLSLLDLSINYSLESLPNSITNLTSLVSLILKGCDSLKHVPPLGELQALSRLVISHTSIEKAPEGLEKLINLKCLDLSNNKRLNLELGSFSLYFPKLQYLDLEDTCALIMLEDVQGMKMLECLRGAIDCKLHNESMQHNLDMSFGIIKTYHLILGTVSVKSDWGEPINLISFFPGDFKNRCIEFQDCDRFTHILPKDHTHLRIRSNNHWVGLCDGLPYSTSSSVRTIQIDDCHKLESLFCLFGSCSFCTNIHKLKVLELSDLKSLTAICKDVGQSLLPVAIFSCLTKIHIYNCPLIGKLLTPQLVQQLQNLESISVRNCDSMKEIFAASGNVDGDSSVIPLPKLTYLKLYSLPELKIVCKGSIRCRSSPKVTINDCPNLEKHPTIEIRVV